MAFILKNNPTVINIKLTNAGRKALAEGRLNFDKWAVGDSEIDYRLDVNYGINPFFTNILRPKDANGNLIQIEVGDIHEGKVFIESFIALQGLYPPRD
jgi:hypothetical protein